MSEKEVKFRAQIKKGAAVFQDHGFYRWPDVWRPNNVDLEFEATLTSNGFDMRADGHGGKPYGNGSIHVWGLDDLIISDHDRARVVRALQDRLTAELVQKQNEVIKVADKIAALRAGH